MCVGVGFVLCSLLLLLLSSCLLAEMLFFSFFFLSGFVTLFSIVAGGRGEVCAHQTGAEAAAQEGKQEVGRRFFLLFNRRSFGSAILFPFSAGGGAWGERTHVFCTYTVNLFLEAQNFILV